MLQKPIVFIEVPLYNALLMLQKSHEIRQKKPLYFLATYVIILYVVLVNLLNAKCCEFEENSRNFSLSNKALEI